MNRAQAGFTLLEVLVAAALMAMVLMGVSAAFQGVVTLYNDVRDQRTEAQHARMALTLLADDFRSIVPRGGLSTGAPKVTKQRKNDFDTNDELHLVTFVSGVSLEERSVEPQLAYGRVTYALHRNSEDPNWTLVRTLLPHPHITAEFPEERVRLVGRVKRATLSFETPDGQWKTGWNLPARATATMAGQPTGLPRTARIELVLQYGAQQEELYELYIPLPA